MLLSRVLRPLIRIGRLTVIDAGGIRHVFGTESEPAVTVRLHDPKLHWKLALNPGLHAGEAWMDGTLTVEDGSLYDFLDLFGRNLGTCRPAGLQEPAAPSAPNEAGLSPDERPLALGAQRRPPLRSVRRDVRPVPG